MKDAECRRSVLVSDMRVARMPQSKHLVELRAGEVQKRQ